MFGNRRVARRTARRTTRRVNRRQNMYDSYNEPEPEPEPAEFYQERPEPEKSAMTNQLEELQGLKNQGIISEEEFQAKKKQILGL